MLKNKNILLLGAAGLIGRCLVSELMEQGANVYAADINIDTLAQYATELNWLDEQVELIQLDVNSQDQIDDFFESIDVLDGVVNAVYPRNSAYGQYFFDVSMRNFNDNVSLQLGSAFVISQAAAKYFTKHKTDMSLVNLSSVYGVIPPKFEVYKDTDMTMPVEYAAVKSGLIHLTKYIVKYVKNSDFRANCVSPGGILDNQDEFFLKRYAENTNGKGMLDAHDIAGTVIFLLSEKSKYITGQNIVVDDGFSL